MGKLKILQVVAALNEGGVERGTLEMARYTVSQGAISLVASNGGRLVAELESFGGKHYQLPLASRTPWSVVFSACKLAKIIQQNDVDLVHARSRAPAWAALIACRMTNTKLITSFHGVHKIQNRLKWFYNSVMVRGERVIAISEYIRTHIIDNYHVDYEHIDVAPRGFEPEIFNPEKFDNKDKQELKCSLGIKEGVPIISLPGRLTRLKGQAVFLKALAKLKDIPWHALLIGGAGKKISYEQELKDLVNDLGITDRVHFLGSCSDIARYYHLSDIVVSSSTEPEAFGRVAVEAQAMCKPIIASAHGGSLETIKDGLTGWLYCPSDIEDLAEKIRHALSACVCLETIGGAGRDWVAERYTVEKMCRAEWLAYSSVLQAPSKI